MWIIILEIRKYMSVYMVNGDRWEKRRGSSHHMMNFARYFAMVYTYQGGKHVEYIINHYQKHQFASRSKIDKPASIKNS